MSYPLHKPQQQKQSSSCCFTKLSLTDLDKNNRQTGPNTLLYCDSQQSFYAGKEILRSENKFLNNEIRILRKIGNHQNLLNYIATCTCDEKKLVLLTELCDGTLEEYVKNHTIVPLRINAALMLSKKPANLPQKFQSYCKHQSEIGLKPVIKDLLYQTVHGLRYLHANDIIHRKIQPSNILLIRVNEEKTVAKIGGFKYSKEQNSENGASPPLNDKAALNYMANECFQGIWNKSTDVFAMGILFLFAMTGGKHPFEDDHALTNTNFEKRMKTGKSKNTSNLKALREQQTYTEEENITMVDMIKRMIDHDSNKRLTIEDVFHHPAFYNPEKKLQFLLKVNEGLKKLPWDSDIREKVNYYDARLLNDHATERQVKFEINENDVFRQHQYFLTRRFFESRGIKKPAIWKLFYEVINVESLLKALRDKIAHACDGIKYVPRKFQEDFEVTEDNYSALKFFSVFIGNRFPQLLVHLYKVYKGSNMAKEFYAVNDSKNTQLIIFNILSEAEYYYYYYPIATYSSVSSAHITGNTAFAIENDFQMAVVQSHLADDPTYLSAAHYSKSRFDFSPTFAKSNRQIPKSKLTLTNPISEQWQKCLRFKQNQEFKYWIRAKCNDIDGQFFDQEYTIKDSFVNIIYLAEENSPLKIEVVEKCSISENTDCQTPHLDIVLYTDSTTKSLVAICSSDTEVHYKSHCQPKGTVMKQSKNENVIFCYKQLFETLTSEEGIDFDPSEAVLRFGKESDKKAIVTIRSRVAGGLFSTIVEDPYSHFYRKLEY